MKIENPFIITGYKSARSFCDRKPETKRLISAAENQRNLTLSSLRRLGKTGLIHHTFEKLKKKFTPVYCDIYLTQNINDFIKTFSNSVLLSLEGSGEKFYKKAFEIFKSIKPVVTADKVTGEPSLEFGLKKKEAGI